MKATAFKFMSFGLDGRRENEIKKAIVPPENVQNLTKIPYHYIGTQDDI